jgi:hypothetical protein
MRQVLNATSRTSVPIAPTAMAYVALLRAEGVPIEDLDGVKDLMMNLESRGDLTMPGSFAEIAQQASDIYARYRNGERAVIDVVDSQG